MSEGRCSGFGETEERAPVDMGDGTGSSSTTMRLDARSQISYRAFSAVVVASRRGTYADGRVQERVVILRELQCDLCDIFQRVIADTPKPYGFVGRCDGGPGNCVIQLSQRRQDEDAAAPKCQVGLATRNYGSVGGPLH